jgi:transposase
LRPITPDTVFGVIHDRVERSPEAKRSEVVNNFAPRYKKHGVTLATASVRSLAPRLTKTERRLSATRLASAKTSERTLPREGFCIRTTECRGKDDGTLKGSCMNQQKLSGCFYGGVDWASDHHDVAVVDESGKMMEEFSFHHDGRGWEELRKKLERYEKIWVTVETSQGIVVEKLLETGCEVFPINPKSAERYRERKTSSGIKSDRLDAWALADALRLDGKAWKALKPEDPLVAELKLLTRDESNLIGQRTALVNQLQAALREYYPAALETFDDWTQSSSWAFVETFSTPQKLIAAGKRKWEKFLHAYKLWRPQTAQKRLEIFARADQFCGSPSTTAAKSMLAVSLAKILRTTQHQLDLYRKRIEELFSKHPDHDLFGSLPGAGKKLAPRLLAEIGEDRSRFESAEGLQAYAGTAPITFQSGQMNRCKIRRACNLQLRSAVHQWSGMSIQFCSWAQIYYQNHRQKGKSHACALRCLGHRWLKILWKMWQTGMRYDEALHLKNQTQHGSWVLQLNPTSS